VFFAFICLKADIVLASIYLFNNFNKRYMRLFAWRTGRR